MRYSFEWLGDVAAGAGSEGRWCLEKYLADASKAKGMTIGHNPCSEYGDMAINHAELACGRRFGLRTLTASSAATMS
jgi:hypothetical protein